MTGSVEPLFQVVQIGDDLTRIAFATVLVGRRVESQVITRVVERMVEIEAERLAQFAHIQNRFTSHLVVAGRATLGQITGQTGAANHQSCRGRL